MKNPCHTCERLLLDKNECALGCEHRYDYCEHLGIPTGRSTKPAPALLVIVQPKSVGGAVARTTKKPPKSSRLPKPPRPLKVPKPPKPKYDWHAPRGMRSKGGCLEKATVCIKEGRGNRETCRLTGMSKNTAAKLRGILEKQNGGSFLCHCGRPATHQGWCSYRIEHSPNRQRFMNK
jgi:hypothetical protein